MKTQKFFYGWIGLMLLGGFAMAWMARPSMAQSANPVDGLVQQTGGMARVAYHTPTGLVNFVGTDRAHPIPQPMALKAGATAEDAARLFLSAYGSAFGVIDQSQELTVMRLMNTEDGRQGVRFQQVYQGVPVVGAELIVQMDANQQVLSVGGEILPDLSLDITPTLAPELAAQLAITAIAKIYGLSPAELTPSTPELWIYHPMLLGSPGLHRASLVWRLEVTPLNLMPIRELVLIDAHLGAISLQFNQVDTARNRLTYTANNGTSLPGTLVCDESDPSCAAGDMDAQKAHLYSGSTYDFYFTNHNRDSIDNSGMALVSTVHFDDGYENAFWNGEQMVYGDGYGFVYADDVVAHELTHGVTDYESSLFYYYQSGAINESFSDLWGEYVDQTNGMGDDSIGVKWLLGEDVTGYGAMRNMSNPPAFGDPDRMGSTYYYCSESDNGGVHHNNGVNNKAAYLMTDGGTFNGQTITGIGISKAAKIYYEVQTNLLTTAGDYQDLYNNMQQACTNLIGVGGINETDCQQVHKALLAVEMNTQPASCAATEAPVCPSGQTPNDIFNDNLENPASGRWSSYPVNGTVNQWFYPQNNNPHAFDATYATSGVYNFWGYDIEVIGDYAIGMNSNVSLPAGTVYMHFKHAFGFDGSNYDGAVLEYSLNGGTWLDAGGLFTDNGYRGTIASGYGNPLGGRSAFVGQSYGYISSRLNLSGLSGQNVKFRFRIGTDYSGWDYGWFIDDIRVYTCQLSGPTATPTRTPTKTTTPIGWTPRATQESFLPYLSKDKTPTPTPTVTSPPPLPNLFYASSDSTVIQGYAGTNFGDYSDMMVGYDKDYYSPSLKAVRSLAQFNLSAIPAGTSISSATLNIYFMEWTDVPGTSRNVKSYRINAPWSEMNVTWNNQPSTSESYGSVNIVANSSWGYVSVDVTNLVRAWVNGTYPNYGLMLRGLESGVWLRGFYTREGSHTPYLNITYSGVPTSQEISPPDENPAAFLAPSFSDFLYGSTDGNACLDLQTPQVCFSHR